MCYRINTLLLFEKLLPPIRKIHILQDTVNFMKKLPAKRGKLSIWALDKPLPQTTTMLSRLDAIRRHFQTNPYSQIRITKLHSPSILIVCPHNLS